MTFSSSDDGDLLHRGVLVMAVSVIAGLLLAGASFPLIGGLGLMARSGADSFTKIPKELEEQPLPVRSRILATDGSELAEIYFNENRVEVPIREIPPVMQWAILAIEDERFYQHGGVDYKGLIRALLKNTAAGEVQQGGSTITQQYVKNMLIESATDAAGKKAAVERSTARKIREARYALALEQKYSKREILEKYLNIAYFGQGVYGVGTAAEYFFGKRVQQLSIAESALLAGMVKNPGLYDPLKNPKTALSRRNLVLDKMGELAYITAPEVAKARKTKIALKVTKVSDIERSIAPYFLEYMRDQILDDPAFGDTREERARVLFQGGLTIRTTLDPRIQRGAQQAIASTLNLPKDPASAVVIIKPGTGEIKAMAVQNRITTSKKVNLATGGSTGRQVGSTFKVFTLAAAVHKGLPLGLRIHAPACYKSRIFDNPASGCYRNADPAEVGAYDMLRGTWHSVNTYYVQLLERVGVFTVAQTARDLGVDPLPWPGSSAIGSREGSFTLGARETSPLLMANAYATIAARGLRCKPIAILSATSADGTEFAKFDPAENCTQIASLTKTEADTVTAVLQGVIARGTGRGANIGRPVAGKTGTTQNFGDAWFVGYTPDLAAASWIGDPRGNKYALRGIHGYRVVYGGGLPATIWRKAMTTAHQGIPVSKFVPAPREAYVGTPIAVPDVRGLPVEEAQRILTEAGFTPVVAPQLVPAFPIAAGLVGQTDPAPGQPAYAGSTVALFLSDGTAPTPTPTLTPTPTVSPSPKPTPTGTGSPTPTASPTCNGKKCQTPDASPAPT